MSIAFVVIERTIDRIRWRATSTAVGTAACDSGVIRNRADGTDPEGLRTNSSSGTPIGGIARTATANQAAARRKLNGEGLVGVGNSLSPDLGGVTTGINIARCNLSFYDEASLDCDGTWAIDAQEGAAAGDALSAGFPVITVSGPNTTGATAIIEMKFQHSMVR